MGVLFDMECHFKIFKLYTETECLSELLTLSTVCFIRVNIDYKETRTGSGFEEASLTSCIIECHHEYINGTGVEVHVVLPNDRI